MSQLIDLLSKLRKLDVKLDVEDGRLKISAPKGALDEELKLELKEQKDTIIEFLFNASKDKVSKQESDSIPKLENYDDILATDSQARFWFLEKFSPGQANFNIPLPVEIRGQLDEESLRKSIEFLISRHDSLRTTFVEKEGQPYLNIGDSQTWQLEKIEIKAFSDGEIGQQEIEGKIKSLLQQSLSQGFDLSTGPLMRVQLLEVQVLADDKDQRPRFILLNCIHHIVCDGWSMDIILREIIAAYAAYSQGLLPQNLPQLKPLAIGYADYAHWDRQQMLEGREDALVSFWQQQLKGAKGLLAYPYDRPRPVNPASEGSNYNFPLDKPLSLEINRFCQQRSITPFILLMMAYQIVLAKHSKSQDVSVGIPIAGRTREDIEGLIGLFLNALVIRSQVGENLSVAAYLEQMKSVVLEAFDHQDLSIEKLIDSLQIDREYDEVPGVQFGFILQNAKEMGGASNTQDLGFESDDLSLRPLQYEANTAKHDIGMSLVEVDSQYLASIEYKTSLLDEASIEKFSNHYIRTLEFLLASDEHTCIQDLELQSKEELCQTLNIDADACQAVLPLTPTQEGFYLNELINNQSQSTLIGTSILIEGEFNLEHWQQALQTVSDQRAVLRTKILAAPVRSREAAYQIILKQMDIDFEVLNYSKQNFSLQEAEKLAKNIIYQPFKIHDHALIRYRVIVLDESRYILVTSMHHMLMDAVSALEHWVEVQKIYQNEEIRNDDYTRYIKFACSTIDSDPILDYWQQQLQGVVAADYSVHGHAANLALHKHGERQLKRMMIEGNEWKLLKQYCRRQGITPAIFYKVLFGLVLDRYCQPQSDFYINEIITGRTKEFARTLGNCFLMQPYILREDELTSTSDISMLFAAAKKQQKSHRQYAYLSQQNREKLSPQGRVGFYYNYLTFIPPSDFIGHAVEFRDWGNEIDAALEFNPRLGPDGLELNLFYRDALFRESGFLELIQFLAKQFVSGVSTLGDLRYQLEPSQGAFLTEAALAQQKAILPDSTKTVVDLIEQNAQVQAQKPAVKMKDEVLTYKALNDKANAIASYLNKQSIGKGHIVVLQMEKSPRLLASLLGVLKTSAAYLPLDVSLPEERQNFIIQNSGAKIVLTESVLTEIKLENTTLGGDKPLCLPVADDLAYVIYTSGSTGKPKGVKVAHGALLGTYYGWQESFGLRADDQHLQMASVGFDVFTGDWVRALCSGACLHLVGKEVLMNPPVLDQLIEKEKISIGEFVPVVLRALLSYKKDQSEILDFRMLIVGSDAWFESDHVLLNQQVKRGTRLVNSYGVTEAVIDSSYFESVAGDVGSVVAKESNVSIGKPFANTSLYVMDDQQTLLPKEVAGELYIAGPDIAEGYLNDEQQTVQAYLNDPYSESLSLMYRTGDRAKVTVDGELILLGRIGNQAKIRGFRVELGEIESQLSLLPEVDEVIVLAIEADSENNPEKRLVAYIVFHQNFELNASEIRQRLSQKLPDYMLPQACMSLDKFPLNANGKLDRNALPAPDFSEQSSAEYVAARNEVEEILLTIWQSVLGVEKIGVYDSFFDLGGHSLLATQVVSRIKTEFGKDIPLKTIFEDPTIAYLAAQLDLELKKADYLQAPEITKVAREALMPVSYAQQRFWFLDQLIPGFFAFNMPFAIRLRGSFDFEAFQLTIDEIFQRHEILRASFVNNEGRPAIKVGDKRKGKIQFKAIDVAQAADVDAEIECLTQINAHAPFNLAEDDLLRFSVLEIDQQDHVLFGCMHHIVSDGWSIRLLFKEITLIYSAFVQQRPSPLSDLALQYLDYAAWEQSWLVDDVLEKYTDYWLRQLDGAPEILRLPTDKPRPQAQTFNGKQIRIKKSLAFKHQLEAFSRKQNASTFMTLIAAMSVLMSRYSGEDDILIGTPVAGRNLLASEEIIGLFLNAIILRCDLSDKPSVRSLMQQVRETCLDAFAHQDMPAEILYEKLAKHRNPQFPAGAQVGLVLQNTATQQSEFSGTQISDQMKDLSIEFVGVDQVISNYDFGFTIVELDDGIDIIAEFNTDLFFDETIDKMLHQYIDILGYMFVNEDLSISRIDLVDENQLFDLLDIDKKKYSHILPLTAMQESMYFANKLNPGSKEYGVGFTVRMHNTVDLGLWTSSLQGLIDTQDVCRVSFHENNIPYIDAAYQLIEHKKKAKVEFVDWSTEHANNKVTEQEIEVFASQFINAPYNILKDDLLRVMLIKISEDYYIGVFAAHHILMDGIAVVAFGVMGAMNYEIVHNGGQALVHEDKYKEYLAIDRATVDTDETVKFWQQTLRPDGVEARDSYENKMLEALDYPVQMQGLFSTEKVKKSLTLSSQHWNDIKIFCKKNRITPAIYFKAIFGMVLGRYCRAEGDFFISEILAARPQGHMNALGCYFQQIPIVFYQNDLEVDSLVGDLFKALRQYQKRYKNKQLISVPAQMALLPPGRLSFMYNFENYIPDFHFLGEKVEIQEYSNQVNGIVQLLVKTLVDSAQLNLQFQQGFFDDFSLLERMESFSQQILTGSEKIGELELLSDDTERQQQSLWNNTNGNNYNAKFAENKAIHQLFEEQVELSPEGKAVSDNNGAYTYRRLNQKANQLAHYLIQQGVGLGDVVGVCLPLCKDIPLAIMAILKTGAAYLPMDVKYPDERLAFFINDSKPKVVLTLPVYISRLPVSETSVISILDKDIEVAADKNLDLCVSEQNLIYVLYTSGSTGLPKCTASYHHNEANLLAWYCGEFAMKKADKILLISAFGFDLTQKNLFAPLMVGAELIFSQQEHYDARAISDEINTHKISWLNCAPSAFYPLVESFQANDLQSLRLVFLGGEALAFDRLSDWYRNSECQVINSYGPSECTDISSYYVLDKNSDYQTIPIGKPSTNVELFILDTYRKLLPVGVPGELYVGGAGVGAGYIKNESLNEASFFESDFSDGLIYKTGDVVKYLPDGNVEYIGRNDFQIKIRGVRIELGEIETKILENTAIKACVVTLRQPEERLVAYIILNEPLANTQLLIEKLEQVLRTSLPAIMLPSDICIIDQFPLSSNGKIDREALPEPTLERNEDYVETVGETEKTIANIWQNTLNISQVSRYDNFFELGGHSLIAVQVMSRINQHFGTELPLAILFEAQNLDLLAMKVDAYGSNDWQALVTIQKANELSMSGNLFCIHPVGGEVFCYRELARELGPNVSVYGLQASGLVGRQDIISDIDTLVDCYIKEIKTQQETGPYFLCGQSIGGVIAFAVANKLEALGDKVAQVSLFDSFVPGEETLEMIGIDHLKSALGAFMKVDSEDLQKLTELEHLENLFDQAKAAYLIPQDIKFSQVSSRYLVAKANVKAALNSHLVPLRAPVIHFAAKTNISGLVSQDGWGNLATEISFESVAGDHESILQVPNVSAIAVVLLDAISLEKNIH